MIFLGHPTDNKILWLIVINIWRQSQKYSSLLKYISVITCNKSFSICFKNEASAFGITSLINAPKYAQLDRHMCVRSRIHLTIYMFVLYTYYDIFSYFYYTHIIFIWIVYSGRSFRIYKSFIYTYMYKRSLRISLLALHTYVYANCLFLYNVLSTHAI